MNWSTKLPLLAALHLNIDILSLLASAWPFAIQLIIAATRLLLPYLGIRILVYCAASLLKGKSEPEIWGWLVIDASTRLPIHHWENIIGRGKSSDIMMNLANISRSHAALIRDKEGQWTLTDLCHRKTVMLNGEVISSSLVQPGDCISLGGNKLRLTELSAEEVQSQRQQRPRPRAQGRPLGWLTLFILLLAGQMCAVRSSQAEAVLPIAICFFLLLLMLWFTWLFSRSMRRVGFEVETLGFLLTTIGFGVIASSDPLSLPKYCLVVALGLALFFLLGWILRDIRRVKALRWPAAGLALALLGYVMLRGEIIFGARNWITIAGFSFQPSELVKVMFIFSGAATLDRLFAKRNLYAFILLSLAIVGMLARMSDFGTAVIFFTVFLIIAYLRSGDVATIALAIAGAVLAAMVVLAAKPYIASRFASWRHAWEFVNEGGFQQTRTMGALASGGLFGLGGGQGWLKYVAAADTDLVFGFVAEEWGVLLALTAVSVLVTLALFAIKASTYARSSYYVIAACGASGLFLVQMLLNVGGSLDLLPLTGVTFPFISHGGSSLLASWGLLAFLKAVDTRQNASFATSFRRKSKKAAPPLPESPFDVVDWQVNSDE